MRKARTTLRQVMLISLGVAALAFLGLGIVLLLFVSPLKLQGFLSHPFSFFKPLYADGVDGVGEEEPITFNPIEVTDSGQTYTVRDGEDLYAVAIRFGVSPSALRILNKLPSIEVTAGMVLKIPDEAERSPPQTKTEATPTRVGRIVEASEQTYTVRDGEDLYVVAIRVGVSPSDLKTLNNLPSNEVRTGMVLKIPSGGRLPPQTESAQAESAEAETVNASGLDSTGQTYTVRAGEDIYTVAIRVGVSPSDLRNANKLNSSSLAPGMVLKLPNVEK